VKICFILKIKTQHDPQTISTKQMVYQTWAEVSSYVAHVLGFPEVKDLDIFEDVLSEKFGIKFKSDQYEVVIQPASLRG